MQLRIDGYARDLMAQFGESDAPGQIRRFAPTASGGKASLSPEHISERDSRGARVGGLPPRQLPAPHQKVSGDHRAQQPAVKDATRSQKIEREELQRMLAILRLGEEHQDLRTDKR